MTRQTDSGHATMYYAVTTTTYLDGFRIYGVGFRSRNLTNVFTTHSFATITSG